MVCGREFNIRGFLGTKWQASLMSWVPRSPDGRRDSEWGLAGTADGTTRVSNAGVGASFTATTWKLQALLTTEDIRNTWLLPSKHWRPYPTHLVMPKQARCCA